MMGRLLCLCWSLLFLFPSLPVSARELDKLTYLLPASREAIVLAPFVLAESNGLYRKAGLDVTFAVVSGGFKVGEALARGEGDLGGASGDTPVLLRASGVPVKGIALLGRYSFLTLITRQDGAAGMTNLSDAQIDVPSFADTSYYALQELTSKSLRGPHVRLAKARPPAELIAALGSRQIDGFIGTVDWGVQAERAGVQLNYRKLDEFYPAMAQAVIASEAMIADRPKVLRRFIRATLQAIRLIVKDPEAAAFVYEKALPDSGYSHAEVTRVFRLLASEVYGRSGSIGRFNPDVMRAAETELLKRDLIKHQRPASDYFTNVFIGR